MASIEVAAAIAFVVDALAVKHLRTALTVEFGDAVESQHVGDDAGHHFGNRRATRHVDDRLAGNHLVHRRGARRVGLGGLDAAVGGTRPPADDRLGIGTGFLELFDEGTAPLDAEHAVFVERRIAFDGNDVVALVLLLDLIEDRLGLVAGSGHQGIVVIEREHREHNVLGQRVRRADEGFGAAGALQTMQPKHRRPRLGFQRMGNGWRSSTTQTKRCRRQAAEFHETAPGNSLATQHFVKGLGHDSFPRCLSDVK